MSDQPRNQPRNLQGLLKFCVEGKDIHDMRFSSKTVISQFFLATKAEDPTRPSQFQAMSDEDRKFLEDALKSMTLDVVEELNKAFHVLNDGNASEDKQVAALEVVTSFVADIDTANGS